MRRIGRLNEHVSPKGLQDTVPVVLVGKRGSKCSPFLKIEKDEDKFAACNALADDVGPVNEPKKAYLLIEDAIGDEVNEVFGVMMLDIHLRFKGFSETGRGESSSVMAPVRPTLQIALMYGADAAIIYHVHPSGMKAEPSEADEETTDAFVEAFAAAGLPLLDHVIVGGDKRRRSYYSFAEAGAL